MKQLYSIPADFEALIRIYSFEEGGRINAAKNGMRWDFSYADQPESDPLEISAIWPDFFDEEGDSLDNNEPLPIGRELSARMFVIFEGMRGFHRERIAEGTLFYCHEGARRVAVGHVTKVTGLANQEFLD